MLPFSRNVPDIKRMVARIALGGIILSSFITASSLAQFSTSAGASALYSSASGHSIGGAFLAFYNANGGLRVFGLPLTDELVEGGLTVQYFERQRFEYHPEAAGTPYEVQLSLLGGSAAQGKPALASVTPFSSNSKVFYIPQTGHSVGGVFLNYWLKNGGVRVLGYPVSEPTNENGLTVQYFERARMEYHPEKAAQGFAVELSLLGKDYLQSRIASGAVQAQPGSQLPAAFGAVYTGMEQDLFNRINGARQAAGLQPVVSDPTISGISRQRATDMAGKNYFSHQPPSGGDYMTMLKAARVPYRWAGEIIAENNFPQDQATLQAFNGFMQSPPHYSIITDPKYNYAGIGVARDNNGKYCYTVVFVQK